MVIRGEFSAFREGRSPERKAENSRGRLSAGSVRSEIFVFHDACLHPGIHGKLVANHGPVGCRTVCPFFIKLRKPKIECFQNGVLTGEGSFFGYLSKAGIHRLNRVCSVHDLPNRAAVIEKLLHVDPVSDPHVYRPGILAPGLFEPLKFCFCRPEARSAIDLLELRSVCLVIF